MSRTSALISLRVRKVTIHRAVQLSAIIADSRTLTRHRTHCEFSSERHTQAMNSITLRLTPALACAAALIFHNSAHASAAEEPPTAPTSSSSSSTTWASPTSSATAAKSPRRTSTSSPPKASASRSSTTRPAAAPRAPRSSPASIPIEAGMGFLENLVVPGSKGTQGTSATTASPWPKSSTTPATSRS